MPRYKLRTLLIAVTICGVWLGIQVNRVNRQRRAIATISGLRALIHFEHEYENEQSLNRIPNAVPPGPVWLRNFIGEDYFRRAAVVDFAYGYPERQRLGLPSVADDDLRCLTWLPDLRYIEIGHTTGVTDAGFVHFRNLKRLRSLSLYNTPVTGSGLVQLAGLPRLECLSLGKTRLKSQHVSALAQLHQLKALGLDGTPITDDDLFALGPLQMLESLSLTNTAISDRGLPYLERLTNLRILTLPAGISDEGLNHLQQALPQCQIGRVKQK